MEFDLLCFYFFVVVIFVDVVSKIVGWVYVIISILLWGNKDIVYIDLFLG